jgi:hypothetical protein
MATKERLQGLLDQIIGLIKEERKLRNMYEYGKYYCTRCEKGIKHECANQK